VKLKSTLAIIIALLFVGFLLVWQWPNINRPRILEIKKSAGSGSFLNFDPPGFHWSIISSYKEPENFLLLGAPGQGNDAPDLTDTILIARLDLNENKVFLFSLPRDLLVRIPGQENYAKLNALYAFNKRNTGQEFSSLIKKTEEITGLKINHYIFVDLQTVKNIVDILGGVNVLVKKDIIDEKFPGPNHSFQTFKLLAGWRYLDGNEALKYIRSRHSLGGDFDRILRQQEILQALKQKVLTLNLWDFKKIIEIYQNLSANIKTDLGLWQIQDYWQEIKKLPGENIIRNELASRDFFTGGQILLGNEIASIIKPTAGVENYEEIKIYIAEAINK
jgi:LCP family protein required for cell wall assembly